MPVLLRTRRALPPVDAYDFWASIGSHGDMPLDPGRRAPGLAFALEDAFTAITEDWLALARELSGDPSASLAHAPACAANVSDLGQMMAWARLVASWAAGTSRVLIICDDPWMYRHLSQMPGVLAGRAPRLRGSGSRLWLRGFAARTAATLRFVRAAVHLRTTVPKDQSYILVYGHPKASADGLDGYFGDLMRWLPDLRRVLHVDCGRELAEKLSGDGRSVSLHAFGSLLFAARLPFAKWRPSRKHREGRFGWLVRRAAAREGGSGQAAAICWQIHCQSRFLKRARPRIVAWPWENHGWERRLVPAARTRKIATIGYQHSVVGALMLNYSPHSGAGPDKLPDRIVCNGEATRRRLIRFGVPAQRLSIGGALRYTTPPRSCHHDDNGPVFVALPFDAEIARQMVAACRTATSHGWAFLLKDHPMTPFNFRPEPGLERSPGPLGDAGGLRAVLYAATAVGQEAILAGIPTLRYLPDDRVAIDVLPEGIEVASVTYETLAEALVRPSIPTPLDPSSLFGPVDRNLWKAILGTPSGDSCPAA